MLAHIRVLERSGLIGTAKQGRVRTCEVRPKALSETGTDQLIALGDRLRE